MTRLISLAAGVCPEIGPAEFVTVCAAAGWPACGIWFHAETWNDQVARDVRQRLDDTGLVALDMEPLFISSRGDHGDRLIQAAVDVGARNVLVVGRGVTLPAFTDRFAQVCDLAAPAGINCAIEFIPFFDIKTVADACAVIRDAARPNGAVLADNLHLARSGGTPDDIARQNSSLFPYAQLCDAAAGTPDNLYEEAVDGRMTLGDGQLPLSDFVSAFTPQTPFSLEIRSASLRADYPEYVSRASHVLRTTQSALAAMTPTPDL